MSSWDHFFRFSMEFLMALAIMLIGGIAIDSRRHIDAGLVSDHGSWVTVAQAAQAEENRQRHANGWMTDEPASPSCFTTCRDLDAGWGPHQMDQRRRVRVVPLPTRPSAPDEPASPPPHRG